MKFSELYESYGGMCEPSYQLKIGGRQLDSGKDVRLLSAACRLSCKQQAGVLHLEAQLDPKGDCGSAWLEAFQIGAACSFSLGYGKNCAEVFCGFVYELTWDDPLADGALGLEVICLDVCGALMLSSCADAGTARTMSQMIKTILDQPCCSKFASGSRVSPLPADWDLPAQRSGASDFAVICAAADFACYEFYACAGELYFGEPRPQSSPVVTFEGAAGQGRMQRRKTLAGQCAAVSVSGTDDKGERVFARQARTSDSGFGVKKMKDVLSGDFHQPEPTLRTMAQAKYLSKARMEARQHLSGALIGQVVGLPEIRPGRFLEVTGLSEPVNGSFYVYSVLHTLDQTGFMTSFEAEE